MDHHTWNGVRAASAAMDGLVALQALSGRFECEWFGAGPCDRVRSVRAGTPRAKPRALGDRNRISRGCYGGELLQHLERLPALALDRSGLGREWCGGRRVPGLLRRR